MSDVDEGKRAREAVQDARAREARGRSEAGPAREAVRGAGTPAIRASGADVPPGEPAIRAAGVRAELGGREILHGIDLDVRPGELVGLIGPNGSGKSTLLKCIYRVLAPSGGAVFLDGRPLGEYPVRQSARRVAVLAQHTTLDFEFTVRDIVLMGRSPHKRALERDTAEDFEIVAEALRLVGLAGFEERTFSTLSGGERQRVVLARALAQQTPVLILDEPTNHLDVRYQLELMDIVRALGKTVICAVHDLNVAAMYCERLFAIRDGRVVASGTPEQVITPEVISTVYDVEARVIVDDDGVRHVLYRPGGYRRTSG